MQVGVDRVSRPGRYLTATGREYPRVQQPSLALAFVRLCIFVAVVVVVVAEMVLKKKVSGVRDKRRSTVQLGRCQ
jgi:hypothetical protein